MTDDDAKKAAEKMLLEEQARKRDELAGEVHDLLQELPEDE